MSEKVRQIAVENFLGSLTDESYSIAARNLARDARMYRWNEATVNAIIDGLRKRFEGIRG